MDTTTCIVCPRGCTLNYNKDIDGFEITGNKCKRGVEYLNQELVVPLRHLSTTISIINSDNMSVIPVHTKEPIPIEIIQRLVVKLNEITLVHPIEYDTLVLKEFEGIDVLIYTSRESY